MFNKIVKWCKAVVAKVTPSVRPVVLRPIGLLRQSVAFAVALGLSVTALLAQAPPDPSEDVITAIEGIQGSALAVIGAAGGVLVAIGIVAVLWRIGLKWLRRVGSGG